MTPGCAPAGSQAAVRDRAGARRWPRLLLITAGLLLQPESAVGNPWGLAVDPAARPDRGGRDHAPRGPAWDQGSAERAGGGGARAPDDQAQSGSMDTGDPAPGRQPTWTGGWPPAGAADPAAAPYGPPAAAPTYRFRTDAEGPATPTRAGPPGNAEAPPPGASGYHFRGDPPSAGYRAGGEPNAAAYRFRPLSEREQGRQGPGTGARPAAAGARPRHPSGTPPAWPPGDPREEAGPWPSR